MPDGYLVPGDLLAKLTREAARTAAGEFEEIVPGQWQVGPEPAALRRFHLIEDLPACGNAAIWFYDENKEFINDADGYPEEDTLYDPLGIGKCSNLANGEGCSAATSSTCASGHSGRSGRLRSAAVLSAAPNRPT